jgi:predicted PurR-regulated permease PerM
MSLFTNIQNKSNEWKKRFSLVVSLIIVFVIAISWFIHSIPKKITTYSQSKGGATELMTKISDPLKKTGREIGEAFSVFSSKFKRATTTASTTASTTDLVQ